MQIEDNFNKQYQTVLLNTFRVFIDFLEKHNLRYYACGGTAIGAVRHNGIIPWDDDIDIFMPRKDYEELKKIRTKLSKEYSLIYPEDKDSSALYAKFINNNTTFWELEQMPYIYGIFIDIFPIDNTYQSRDEFLKTFKKIHRIRQLYFLSSYQFSLRQLLYFFKPKYKKLAYMNLLSLFFPRCLRLCFRNYFLTLENNLKGNIDGGHLVSYLGSYYEKEYLDENWFSSFIEFPFSDLTIKLPVGYDEYLKNVYGDYMKLPPIEKQVAEHLHYYVNLSTRLSRETIIERVKKGNNSEI